VPVEFSTFKIPNLTPLVLCGAGAEVNCARCVDFLKCVCATEGNVHAWFEDAEGRKTDVAFVHVQVPWRLSFRSVFSPLAPRLVQVP
jgi:hypothetical protein